MHPADPLHLFLPPVQHWFRSTLGEPTPAQAQGWPAIAAGKHTLILAPTGSGKTLAAFLACLDQLWRQDPLPRGVRVLYVSPLKALNNDIYRNLQVPLEGVTATARELGQPLPALTVALRTGDTPAAERQRLVRRPPHVLITTPESLHLLLTSRARETLRGLTHCIIDEIHALCPNKRGVFLALLLERLAALNPHGFIRIGLSATQRPLDEVARYLGGSELGPDGSLQPRPVTVVDAGLRKDLDLQVISPVEHFGPLPEKSIWPSIYRRLLDEIRQHRSTIIFANNRRTVERITAHLNEMTIDAEEQASRGAGEQGSRGEEAGEQGSGGAGEKENLSVAALTQGNPLSPAPLLPCSPALTRAHHGSLSLDERRQTEQALKEGRLRAVVATASLELGIDMGAVDLVCQVESPGSIARGLQRVGRAGHLVGQKSKGRLLPKTLADLLEQAVLAHAMAAGHVEELRVPINCLDVLAQQIVALTAMDALDVPALHTLVRRAYPFRDLSPQALEGVLEMVSGRFRWGASDWGGAPLTALQPRVSWDRVHNRLHALPGSQQLALVSGGAIPDTGQYAAYLADGTRIGELDEEFVYERRVGDVFLLGTNAWRLEKIEADRVLVSAAEGAPALVPFWRGENVGRSPDLGLALGRFLRELAGRLETADCQRWLETEYHLDAAAARNLRRYVGRQLDVAGGLPTDQTLLIEASRDQLGDWQIILLSPLGHRLHLTLRLALEARLRQRLGYGPQCLHHDDGILVRLTDTDEPPLDLLEGLTPDNVEDLILGELAESALFALRFRQNAARALLLPRLQPGKRAPLWLQRLRGRDLLQVARRHRDFPIVAETFRECLHDHLDLPRLQQLLGAMAAGSVRVVTRRAEAPSPFAAGLLFSFTAAQMYQGDQTDAESGRRPDLDRQLLEQLVTPERHDHLLDPRAIHQVERRLRGIGRPPRSATEMAEWLRRLGDLTGEELEGPMRQFLHELEADGRARTIDLPGVRHPRRWVSTEDEAAYRQAFGTGPEAHAAAATVLARFLHTHALVSLADVLERYPFEETWARRQLEAWAQAGRVVPVEGEGGPEPLRWSAPANLDQVQRGSLALRRQEIVACSPGRFADFLLHWQYLHPAARHGGPDGLAAVLDRLQGLAVPAELWEQAVLPGRMPGYQSRWLDEGIAGGEWVWVGRGTDGETGPGGLLFWNRAQLLQLPAPATETDLRPDAARVLEQLRNHGAAFVTDLAPTTGLSPGAVRAALWDLVRRRLVSNDQFDVIRRGEPREASAAERAAGPLVAFRAARRRAPSRPEGRWANLTWGRPEPEEQAVFLTGVLLHRYGIVTRELAQLDAGLPPWRLLYEVLSRLELAGDVRRGYFVEGLSGAQFALPEAVQQLQNLDLPSTSAAPVVLVHSLDPANLYGSGAPLDVNLLEGGTQALLRRPGNWLVLRAGLPVLIVEQQGQRLTALPTASPADWAAAVACLPAILAADRGLAARHKLTVAQWNGQPVTTTAGRELLEAAGFVRDYQHMTLYAGMRSS